MVIASLQSLPRIISFKHNSMKQSVHSCQRIWYSQSMQDHDFKLQQTLSNSANTLTQVCMAVNTWGSAFMNNSFFFTRTKTGTYTHRHRMKKLQQQYPATTLIPDMWAKPTKGVYASHVHTYLNTHLEGKMQTSVAIIYLQSLESAQEWRQVSPQTSRN